MPPETLREITVLWQWLAVGLLIAVAAAFLLRRTWQTWSGTKQGCGGACDCSGKSGAAKEGTVVVIRELTLRKRESR